MQHLVQNCIPSLIHQTTGLNLVNTLKRIAANFPGKVVFSTSFSFEDQVITDIILANRIPIDIFTLDTGRLFAETYSVWSSTNEKYATTIKPFYPDQVQLEEFVGHNGPNAFYRSVELRKTCCYIRKVEPLTRALKGNSVWITGLRAEHSPARHNLEQFEWDEANGVIKYHPILHWTTNEVKQYIANNGVPYNPLHDKGFVSIGCAPCTRAIRPGEDFRAGRWWWEDNNKKECGLHERSTATQSTNLTN